MKIWVCTLIAVSIMITATSAQSPTVSPAQVGLSTERLARIGPWASKEIGQNRLAGGIGLIARRGKIAYFETYGVADKEADRQMTKDTIFRIFSMTKAVTGVAVMMLYEEGRFALTDPVSRYLPEFSSMKVAVEKIDPVSGKTVLSHTVPAERPIRILDLLRHTSGLNYSGPHDEKGDLAYQKAGLAPAGAPEGSLAEFVKKLAQVPLVHQPGTIWDYSFSIDVLGRLVEVVSGQSLDRFFEERILSPLKMGDTAFFVPESKWGRLAALYTLNPDGSIKRASDAEQEFGKRKPAVWMGGAGLTSTASDYARFVQMLLNGGQLDSVQILSPKTVELMRADVLGDLPKVSTAGLPPPGYGFGLTFAVNRGPSQTGSIVSRGEYNWGGAAGTAFWIDPQEQMAGVWMMQTMLDLGKGDRFKQLAYQAIVEKPALDR
jgi:CubicO group peptidase (beta-lactamase class C family)